MADYMRALKGPVLGWVAVDLIFIAVFFIDGVGDHVGGLVPLLLVGFGVWAGMAMAAADGKWFDIGVAGIVVGAACGALTMVFMAIHMPDAVGADYVATFIGNVSGNLFGAIIGGGYALTK